MYKYISKKSIMYGSYSTSFYVLRRPPLKVVASTVGGRTTVVGVTITIPAVATPSLSTTTAGPRADGLAVVGIATTKPSVCLTVVG